MFKRKFKILLVISIIVLLGYSVVLATSRTVNSPERFVITDNRASLSFAAGDDVKTNSFNVNPISVFPTDFSIEVMAKINTIDSTQVILLMSGTGEVALTTRSETLRWEKAAGGNLLTYPIAPRVGEWFDAVLTFDSSESLVSIYLNGILADTTTDIISGSGNQITFQYLSTWNGTNENLFGNIDRQIVWDRELTPQEISDMYHNDIIPSGATLRYNMDEATLTTVYDSSGNGNNSTSFDASWSDDTPSKKRKIVGDNLVPNGDFETYPPWAGSSTTSVVNNGAWESAGSDGANSGAKDVYKWKADIYNTQTPYGTKYDFDIKHSGNASMRLWGADIKERVNITLGLRNFGDLNNIYDIRDNLIRVQPNVEYTYSIWAKIIVDSYTGDISDKISANFLEHRATGFKDHNYVYFSTSTEDWVNYTGNFTTTNDTRFINTFIMAGGSASDYWTGTLWVDDIVLKPTLPNNIRKVIHDDESSLSFNTTGADVVLPYTNYNFLIQKEVNNTVSFWIKTLDDTNNLDIFSTSGGGLYYLRQENPGRYTLRFWDGVAWKTATTKSIINDGMWHMITCVVEKDTNQTHYVYVDGVMDEKNVNALQVDLAPIDSFQFGHSILSGVSPVFHIKDFNVWNIALTGEQINDMYYNRTIPETGLFSRHALNEGTGSTAYDIASSTLNGTINGATWTTDTPTKLRATTTP